MHNRCTSCTCDTEVTNNWKGYTKSVCLIEGNLFLPNKLHESNAIFELRWSFTVPVVNFVLPPIQLLISNYNYVM